MTTPALGWKIHRAGTGSRTRDEVNRLKTDLRDIDVLVREVLQNSLDAWHRASADFVRVRFRLRSLTGKDKRAFLESLSASEYLGEARRSREYEERLAASARGNRPNEPVVSAATLRALDAHDPEHPLVLLIIEDYGATGLTGAELDNEAASRFCACCRDAEFSVKQHRESGGSYGKGKNVLWHHARSRLVLFYSHLSSPHKGETSRFIGVGKLPWHADKGAKEGEGRYSGRCEFADPDKGFSLVGSPAEDAASALGMSRDGSGETGTSICLVAFEPLSDTQGRSVAEEIKRIAETYYWPAILEGRIEVEVLDEATGSLFTALPDERPELRPYAEAYESAKAGAKDVSRHALVKIPKHGGEQDHAKARMTVGCRLLDESVESDPPTDAVALIRGFGMVVSYRRVKPQRINATPYVGVCLAGVSDPTATRSERDKPRTAAERMESLLAFSEPEAHDLWNPNAFQGLDWRGAKTAVEIIQRHIRDFVSDMAGGGTPPTEGATMPELAKRFRLTGAPEAVSRLLSIKRTAEPEILPGGQVRFSVGLALQRKAATEPAELKLRLAALTLDGVAGRRSSREPAPIVSATVDGSELELQESRQRYYATVDLAVTPLPFAISVLAAPGGSGAVESHYGLVVSADLGVAAGKTEDSV